MKTAKFLIPLSMAFLFLALSANAQRLSTRIKGEVRTLSESFDAIPEQRKSMLDQTAWTLTGVYQPEKGVDILLIDSDNSTISQMGQAWLQAAFYYFRLEGMNVGSGGLNAGQIDPRTLTVLENRSFKIKKGNSDLFEVDFGSGTWDFYSKAYNDPKNTQSDYVAILMDAASQMELENVASADQIKKPLTYELQEAGTGNTSVAQFDQLNETIAREMIYIAHRIKLNFAENQ
ncbi:MAG: hypothetical protein WBG90_09975 [Saonia sp.]